MKKSLFLLASATLLIASSCQTNVSKKDYSQASVSFRYRKGYADASSGKRYKAIEIPSLDTELASKVIALDQSIRNESLQDYPVSDGDEYIGDYRFRLTLDDDFRCLVWKVNAKMILVSDKTSLAKQSMKSWTYQESPDSKLESMLSSLTSQETVVTDDQPSL